MNMLNPSVPSSFGVSFPTSLPTTSLVPAGFPPSFSGTVMPFSITPQPQLTLPSTRIDPLTPWPGLPGSSRASAIIPVRPSRPAAKQPTIAEEAFKVIQSLEELKEAKAQQATTVLLSNVRKVVLDAAMEHEDSVVLDLVAATHETYSNPYTHQPVDMSDYCLNHAIGALQKEGLRVSPEDESGLFRITWV